MKKKSERDVSVKTAATPPAEVAPRAPFWPLREEINRLFDEFDPGRWGWPAMARRTLSGAESRWPWSREGALAPTTDLVEHPDAFEITAELPGLSPDDVEITLTDRMLTVAGEKREESEKKEADYHLSERRYGAFRRSLRLPEGIDPDRITAKVANGVLTVTLPKSPEAVAATRKVEVKAA
jgi:HSP20 family protein